MMMRFLRLWLTKVVSEIIRCHLQRSPRYTLWNRWRCFDRPIAVTRGVSRVHPLWRHPIHLEYSVDGSGRGTNRRRHTRLREEARGGTALPPERWRSTQQTPIERHDRKGNWTCPDPRPYCPVDRDVCDDKCSWGRPPPQCPGAVRAADWIASDAVIPDWRARWRPEFQPATQCHCMTTPASDRVSLGWQSVAAGAGHGHIC